jgi:hypothetical protein
MGIPQSFKFLVSSFELTGELMQLARNLKLETRN